VLVVAAVGTTVYLLVFRDSSSTAAADATSSAAGTSGSEGTTDSPASTSPGAVVGRELQGVWTAEAELTDCSGFNDSCPDPLTLDLRIECTSNRCTVQVGGEGFEPGLLSLEDGSYRSNGTVPAAASPQCNGDPVTATWSTTFTAEGDALVGTYSESSRGSSGCGPTNSAWSFRMTRV
jgi:hypothetical protein